MRILLVEDDGKIASFIVKGFKAEGFAVDHADDGEDGLHLALTEHHDAAIIDLMLPKLDGLSLIEQMRREKIKTPVIILSARGSVDDRVKGLHTGGDDYLTKPFDVEDLLAVIKGKLRAAELLHRTFNQPQVTEPAAVITLTIGDRQLRLDHGHLIEQETSSLSVQYQEQAS